MEPSRPEPVNQMIRPRRLEVRERVSTPAAVQLERQKVPSSSFRDPMVHSRIPRMEKTRLQLAELDVLESRAVALRANAEMLAAVARTAQAKAHAAAEEAMRAEHKVLEVGQYTRRAA